MFLYKTILGLHIDLNNIKKLQKHYYKGNLHVVLQNTTSYQIQSEYYCTKFKIFCYVTTKNISILAAAKSLYSTYIKINIYIYIYK